MSSNNKHFKKRAPPKNFSRKNDIYVTNKTDFRATFKKCESLLNSEEGEIFLHCIGNAINRGINLALKLSEELNFKFEANTSTIKLIGK
jgi:ribonuclease P/MRP protein subunit RPP20